jgi:carnitine-CoA ligase
MGRDDYLQAENSLYATLRKVAADRPEREFTTIAGKTFTYRHTLDTLEAVGRGLLELGLEPGDRVGIMADNVPEAMWAWLGANAARLIDVPFNVEARGRLLAYFVEDAEPRVLLGTRDYLAILAETISLDPEIVVCIDSGEDAPFGDRARHMTFDELLGLGSTSDRTLVDPAPSDTATIMFTSGTTGPSKGVMLPQRYYPAFGAMLEWVFEMTEDDVFYTPQPLFHIDPRAFTVVVIQTRSKLVLGTRFSVSRFWDEVRSHEATMFGFIGTMMWLLYKQEPRPDDSNNPARAAICSAVPHDVQDDFERRFGVKILEGYGMTECVCITQEPPGSYVRGLVGRPAPHVDVAVLDDDDNPVDVGTIGQICFRPKAGFVTATGYWRKPAETVEAWRNLWFHTGDMGRRHPNGQYEFVGRMKDAIRRRGENVSAWEVEQAISAHPDVMDVAAIGVPSEVGEEDVAVLLVAVPGRSLNPAELIRFAERDLPSFAVPRYIEMVDELPKTHTLKIAKDKVRQRGITNAAWDANVALGRR